MSHYMTALAMKQRGLKPSAKIVLYWLADHHNEETGLCFPSLKTLATECEMNKSTLIRHLDALEELGLILRDKRDRQNGSRTSNSYRLTLTPVAECNHPCRKTQQAPVAKRNSHTNLGNNNLGSEPEHDHRDAAIAPAGNHEEPAQGGVIPSEAPKASPPFKQKIVGGLYDGCQSLDEEFERVWAKHPRKVGKGAARRAWAKARAKTDFRTIAEPLALWIKLQAGTDAKFIPHFSTWLNQERWFDDQTHARNKAETTSDRLDRLGANSTEAEGDQLAGPTRTLPEIELRID